MNYLGVLVCSPSGTRKNIGDYIQSVAQAQFLETIDVYVEREQLADIQSDSSIKVIMNGWFMFHPEKFPPSKCIKPLFISFHITPGIAHTLLSHSAIEYLKSYEPIGTRDLNTKAILESHGIKSYFSGCLTTTLGYKYRSFSNNKNQIVFVDPFYCVAGTRQNLFNIKRYFRDAFLLCKNYRKVNHFIKQWDYEFRTWYGKVFHKLEKRVCASVFYEEYRRLCTDDVIFHAKYITHNIPSTRYKSNDEWMSCAEELIKCYASAQYVITSRIHCALPCVGIETPAVFIVSDILKGDSLRSSGRFGGLLEQVNTLDFNQNFAPGNSIMREIRSATNNGKFCRTTRFTNPLIYKEFRDRMIEKILGFIDE